MSERIKTVFLPQSKGVNLSCKENVLFFFFFFLFIFIFKMKINIKVMHYVFQSIFSHALWPIVL